MYKVELARDREFKRMIDVIKTSQNFIDLTIKSYRKFYWRVSSISKNQFSLPTGARSFIVKKSKYPIAPKVYAEFMLFTNESDIDNYALYWQKLPRIKNYTVEIYRDKELKQLVLKDTRENNIVHLGGTLYGQYYYRVKVKDLWDRESKFSPLSKMVSRVAPFYFLPKLKAPINKVY